MNELTLRRLDVRPEDRVLEVGFGGGHLLERILSATPCEFAAGVDISEDMVRVAARRLRRHLKAGRAELLRGDIEAIPYGEGEFTKLCSVNTIYFWERPDAALNECRRVLRPGGRVALCFNSKADLLRWPGHRHGFRLYELGEFEGLLRAANFESVEAASGHDPAQGEFYCVTSVAA